MPAAFATLAMPCARARWRRAIRSTRGSSLSSNAALRYSAAKSGSLRRRRTNASSWEMLALRFMVSSPFFIVLEVIECPVNVGRLFSFVAAAEEQYANSAEHRVIDPVAGPPINPQFPHALAQWPAVAKVPRREPVDSACNLRLRPSIIQLGQPAIEHVFSSAADIMANLDHGCLIVTYKLQLRKPKGIRRVLKSPPWARHVL